MSATRRQRRPLHRRGFIHLAHLPEVSEPKLVLIVSADLVTEHLRPIVVQVTSTARLRGLPTTVELRPGEGGVDYTSYVLCHQINALDSDTVDDDPIGPRLPDRRLVQVEEALLRALDIDVDLAA